MNTEEFKKWLDAENERIENLVNNMVLEQTLSETCETMQFNRNQLEIDKIMRCHKLRQRFYGMNTSDFKKIIRDYIF